MNFKEQLVFDSKNVFHNADEFAEVKELIYDGKRYTAPIILDTYMSADQTAASKHSWLTNKKDYSQGIYEIDAVLYIHEKDVDFIPRHGMKIEIDREIFRITEARFECGEMVLNLRRMDE